METWLNKKYRFRKKITITNSMGSTLNEPYVVSLELDTTDEARFRPDCNDLRITYKEIELARFVNDPDTTTTKVWFKLQKNISAASTDDDYYIYYGAPNDYAPPETITFWNDIFVPDNSAKALVHFEQDPNIGARNRAWNRAFVGETSGHDHYCELQNESLGTAGKNALNYQDGKFSKGLQFDGDILLQVGSQSTFEELETEDEFDIAFWFKPTAAWSTEDTLFMKLGNAEIWVYLHDGTGGSPIADSVICKLTKGVSSQTVYSDGTLSIGTGHFYRITCDGTDLKIYVDGVEVDTGAIGWGSPKCETLQGFQLMADDSPSKFATGLLDCFSFSNTVIGVQDYESVSAEPSSALNEPEEEYASIAERGRRTKYWIKIYDIDGNYKGTFDAFSIAGDVGFTKSIDSGLQGMSFETSIADIFADGRINFHNQVEIWKFDEFTGNEGERIYSGKIYIPKFPISEKMKTNKVTLQCQGIIAELANKTVTDSGYNINFTLNGDQGTILKKLCYLYRANRASVSLSENAPTGVLNSTFGSTRWLGQMFNTVGLTAEQRIIIGVRVRLRYNAGTAGNVGCYLYDSDGGAPALPNVAVTNLAQSYPIENANYDEFNFYFDAPYTMGATTDFFVVLKSQSSSSTITYHWETDNDYYANGYKVISLDDGGTWIDDNSIDMSIELLYVDESRVRLNYDDNSIDLANNNIDVDVHNNKFLYAIRDTMERGNENFYLYIDKNYTVQHHKFGQRGIQLVNCDDTANWVVSLGDTMSSVSDGAREGSGAIQMDCVSGIITSHYIEYTFPGGVVDITSYKHSAPEWVYLPTLTGIDYIAVRFIDGLGNYSEFIVNVTQLEPALEYAVPLDIGYYFMLDKVNVTRIPDAIGGGGCDFTDVTQLRFIVETTAVGVTISGILIDDWRAVNLDHHDVLIDKEAEVDASLDSSPDTIRNKAIFYNNQLAPNKIFRSWRNDESIEKFYEYEEFIQEDDIITESIAEVAANSIIRTKFTVQPKIEKFIINYPANTDAIEPGHTISIKNIPIKYQNLVERLFVMDADRQDKKISVTTIAEINNFMNQFKKLKNKQELESTDNMPPNYMPIN